MTSPAATAPAHRPAHQTPARPGRPIRAEIDRLQIAMPVRPVGVRSDGQMRLPDRPGVLGWYRYGPRPGDPVGSAVLAGHLDSNRYGIGPLADLRRIRPGDRITVVDSTGREHFRVAAAGLIGKDRFPARRVFDRTDRPRLWLITCGGPYDPEQGYRDNFVVEAVPV